MTAFRIALLDYDGTLAITRPAVADCLRRTLLERGEAAPAASRLSAVIASGVPLAEAFEALSPHLNSGQVEHCVKRYREHYPQADHSMTVLYEGVQDAIRGIHDLGVAIVVLSNKGRVAVESALQRFKLQDMVSHVLAADPGMPTKPHPDVFHRRVAPLFGDREASDFLMIGDTAADIRFAQAVGIASCWASYGYGDRDGCRALAPDYEISRFSEAIEIARNGGREPR